MLVYDQRCAAESRRLRKRGTLAVRPTRVIINEAVCEGCGDCGVKSNCLSVQPVDTEFGRKTRIDQTSCNTDYSCLAGDCPSFVTVELPPGGSTTSPGRERPEPPAVPDVERPASGDVFLAGIGGTGIVTVNQVLGSAAVRDGLAVHGVDQTGLSQKAGPVTSHLRIARDAAELGPANRVGAATARCYLAFDVLVGADGRNLGYASPEAHAGGRLGQPGADRGDGPRRRGGRSRRGGARRAHPGLGPGGGDGRRAGARRVHCSATRCRPTCCSSGPRTRRGRCRSRPRRSSGRSR